MSSYKVIIYKAGNLGNQMIQYITAKKFQDFLPNINITGVDMPQWGLFSAYTEDDLGAGFWTGQEIQKIYTEALCKALENGNLNRIIIDGYVQHIDNFPNLDLIRSMFIPPKEYQDIKGYDENYLLINLRGAEILDGIHPGYSVLPIEFYKSQVIKTGLQPVFFGQIGSNKYIQELKEEFPHAIFVEGKGAIHDFEVIRKSKNIIPSISTFSWLAAYLSNAQKIIFPVCGLFNPMHAQNHLFLPLNDKRFDYILFPLSQSISMYGDPDGFKTMLSILGKYYRSASVDEMENIVKNKPLAPYLIEDFIPYFDESFYLWAYPEVKKQIELGYFRNAIDHYINNGFENKMSPFFLNSRNYLFMNESAGIEISSGYYLNCHHHYVRSGKKRKFIF